MSLGKSALGVFLTNGANLVLSFGNSIFLTRTLGVEGKGEFAAFSASFALLSLLLGWSLDTSLRYFLARGSVPRDRILATLVVQVAAVAAAVTVLARLNHAWLGNELLLPGSYQGPAFEVVLGLTVGASLYYAGLSAVFAGLRAFAPFNWATLGFSVLAVAAYGVMFLLEQTGAAAFETGEVILVHLGLLAVNGAALTLLAATRLGVSLRPRLLDRRLLVAMLGYGTLSHVANLAQFLNYRVDIWLVQHFEGAAPLGLYSLAGNLAMMLWILPRSTSTVVLPSLAAEPGEAAFHAVARLSRLVLAATALVAVPLAATAPWWIGLLYGDAFVPAAGAFTLLLLGVVPFVPAVVLAAALAALDRVSLNVLASGVGLVLTVGLDLLLIPRAGIAGAAWASAASYAATSAVTLAAFTRVTGISPAACLVPRPSDLRDMAGLLRRGGR